MSNISLLLTSSPQLFQIPSSFTNLFFCFSFSLFRTVLVFRTQICCRPGICPFWIHAACSHHCWSDWYELSPAALDFKKGFIWRVTSHIYQREGWHGPSEEGTGCLHKLCCPAVSSALPSAAWKVWSHGVTPQTHHHLSCQTRNGVCPWLLNILQIRGFVSIFQSRTCPQVLFLLFSQSLITVCFLSTFKIISVTTAIN